MIVQHAQSRLVHVHRQASKGSDSRSHVQSSRVPPGKEIIPTPKCFIPGGNSHTLQAPCIGVLKVAITRNGVFLFFPATAVVRVEGGAVVQQDQLEPPGRLNGPWRRRPPGSMVVVAVVVVLCQGGLIKAQPRRPPRRARRPHEPAGARIHQRLPELLGPLAQQALNKNKRCSQEFAH